MVALMYGCNFGEWWKPLTDESKTTKLIDDFLKPFGTYSYNPVWQDMGTHWKLVLELPGLEKSSLKLKIKEQKLCLSYSPPKDKDNTDFVYRRLFNYKWSIDENVKESDVMARYENGVLVLTVNKPPEQKKEIKQIPIL